MNKELVDETDLLKPSCSLEEKDKWSGVPRVLLENIERLLSNEAAA